MMYAQSNWYFITAKKCQICNVCWTASHWPCKCKKVISHFHCKLRIYDTYDDIWNIWGYIKYIMIYEIYDFTWNIWLYMKYMMIYEICRPHKYGKYREPFPCPMFHCRPCPSPVESYLQVSKRFFHSDCG